MTDRRRGRRLATGSSQAARAVRAKVRRATNAQGAGESGLARIIELHAVTAAGDALVAVSLAGTLFFAVPTGEARGRVALYLLVTMAPFAVVAPLVGPFLDRFRHGRRWAVGTTTALRAFLCWVMAGAVSTGQVWLYAAAFGTLVASRAYGVSRAAAVPRVLPGAVPLVTANSRISLAGVAGAMLAAPLGVALAAVGPQWSLRLAFVVFVAATVLAIRLPARVDSAAGEQAASLREESREEGPPRQRIHRVGAAVVRALRANTALRAFSGFVTIFLAFVLRDHPVAGLSAEVTIALAAAAAMLGGTLGSTIGSSVRAGRPDRIVLGLVVLAGLAAALIAAAWALATVLVLATLTGLTQQLGRLCLDAVVQREVPEEVRTSAFARSEALLQLAWVAGGAAGIALPLEPALGFGLAAAGLAGGAAATLRVRPPRCGRVSSRYRRRPRAARPRPWRRPWSRGGDPGGRNWTIRRGA